MAHKRKAPAIAIVASALASMAFLLAALAGAAEKLRVGVNLTTIETLPIWLVEKQPAGAGIAISSGNIPSLTAGAADVATHAETQAVRRSPANPDIRVILTVAEYAYHIVASKAAGIRTAADLRGRRIATAPDTSAHFYLVKTLQRAGLAEEDVTVLAMPPSDMPEALARGTVDAVSIWEPAAQRSVQALGDDAVILQEVDYRERFDLNTTTAVLADPVRRAAIVDLVRAIIRTPRIIREHPEEVQPFIAAKLGVPVDTVAAAWRWFRFPESLPDDLLDAMAEQEPWLAKRQNRAPRPRAAIAALIDASVWREALREAPATSSSSQR
jgi:NitT/TauT family transport system substrate-binding protein